VGGARSSGSEGRGHVVDGAEGDSVELTRGGHGFYAVGPDFGGEAESSDYFAEEGGFFVLGFCECDLDVRAEERDGEAREAGPRAEVEEGGGVGVEMAGGEEALSEVAPDDLFRIADRGQVGACVPLHQEVEIGGELRKDGGGNFTQIWCEEGRDRGF
jgi:hypothetical protein